MEKVFIFDMDGVMINSEPIHVKIALEVAEEHNIRLDEKGLEKFVGMRTLDMWGSIINELQLPISAEKLLDRCIEKTVHVFEQNELEPISGLLELLEALKKNGYRIALASSSPAIYINTILDAFGIKKYFECWVSGDDIEQGKPAPDIYLETAKRLGVEPGDCMVLEDSKMGVAAANKAGMTTIGFLNPSSGNQELSEANYVVHSLEEVAAMDIVFFLIRSK